MGVGFYMVVGCVGVYWDVVHALSTSTQLTSHSTLPPIFYFFLGLLLGRGVLSLCPLTADGFISFHLITTPCFFMY